MKKTKIIVPALGLLLLSTAASVTGTVAWFSANTDVDISGMQVTTKVSGNILIADADDDAKYSASDFVSTTSSGILEPVSTINAETFFYTKEDILGTGAMNDDEEFIFQKYTNDTALSTYYVVDNAKAYVDYNFYLKATSGEDDEDIYLKLCNILHDDDETEAEDFKALGSKDTSWRVAMFVESAAQGVSFPETSAATLTSVLRISGAKYFGDDANDKGNAVSSEGSANTAAAGEASNYVEPTFGDVTNIDKAPLIGNIATAGTTMRYHVIVRLWLEGQDTNCNNETYAELTKAYKVDLNVEMKKHADAVPATNITSQVL